MNVLGLPAGQQLEQLELGVSKGSTLSCPFALPPILRGDDKRAVCIPIGLELTALLPQPSKDEGSRPACLTDMATLQLGSPNATSCEILLGPQVSGAVAFHHMGSLLFNLSEFTLKISKCISYK